jgi:hypothetical protein
MNKEIKEMVREHVNENLYLISCDDTNVFKNLFDKVLWKATTSLDHYIFERALALLIAFEEIDLVIAGVNDEGHNLYQRVV